MKELITFLSSLIPFLEIKFSIPLALSLGLSPEAAFFWSILGIIVLTFGLLSLFEFAEQKIFPLIPPLNNFIKSRLYKLNSKHRQKFTDIGLILLFILVVIPAPGTGTYTACLLQYIFKTPFLKTAIVIILGNIVSALILLGGFETIKFFFFQH